MLFRKKPKLLVIGLDSAPPRLLFQDFRDKLPNLREMMDSGLTAPLRSNELGWSPPPLCNRDC